MADIYSEQSSGDGLKDQVRAAGDKLGEAGQSVKAEAAHFAEQAKDRAVEEIETRKAAVGGGLAEFADALRQASDNLGTGDQTMASRLASQAADGLETLARAVTDRSPEDMLRMIRDFGRSNPTAFVAGAALAGFAAGRFARSSAQHPHGGQAEPLPASPSDSMQGQALAGADLPPIETYEIPGVGDPVAADLSAGLSPSGDADTALGGSPLHSPREA